MSRVGEKVKRARTAAGITTKQFAKKLGVSESFVNDIEAGRKIVNSDLMNRLSKVLGQEINDLSMSFEEETFEDVKEQKKYPNVSSKKEDKDTKEIWDNAFSSVLKNVPVYDFSFKTIGSKMLPIIGNKVEGHAQDKVFYVKIQDDDMIGFRIAKDDVAFCHSVSEAENNSICIIEYNDKRAIRQIKRLDSSKLLLISNRGTVRTETVEVKSVKVIAKLDRVEIEL